MKFSWSIFVLVRFSVLSLSQAIASVTRSVGHCCILPTTVAQGHEVQLAVKIVQ
jgi:hypothetical protein